MSFLGSKAAEDSRILGAGGHPRLCRCADILRYTGGLCGTFGAESEHSTHQTHCHGKLIFYSSLQQLLYRLG